MKASMVPPGGRHLGRDLYELVRQLADVVRPEQALVAMTEGWMPEIRSISAVTFVTQDMARAVRFYEALGFSMAYGGETDAFTSFRVGTGYLNLARAAGQPSSAGSARVIFHVGDVDAMHAHVLALGLTPEAPPRDASWGERYFHLTDPDGHALSFARPLRDAKD